MTTEMGPRDDGELTLSERAAARLMDWLVRGLDLLADEGRIRFNAATATLSLSGESEQPDDAFSRGKIVAMLAATTAVVSVMPVMLISTLFEVPNPVVTAVGAVGTAVSGVVGIFMVSGVVDLLDKITVLDHTTEPAPDALDELHQQYVDGEIDESELGDRAAEVWER